MSQFSHRLPRLRVLGFSSERKPTWENSEESIGDFCRYLGRSQCWHAQGPARDLFIRLAAEVKAYLDRNCEPPSRELHWCLYMVGQTKSTARPVLMFICEDSSSRKVARKTIKDSGILLRYPGVDTADCPYPPDFGQLVQLAFGEYKYDSVMSQSNGKGSVLYDSSKTILGSRIFVKDPNRDNSTSRIATAGAIVELGDKICFLTAGHVFESPRPPPDPSPHFECDIDGEGDVDDDDDDFIQTIRQGSRSPMSTHSDWTMEGPEFPESACSSSQVSELDIGETIAEEFSTDTQEGHTGLVMATNAIDVSKVNFKNRLLPIKINPSQKRVSKLTQLFTSPMQSDAPSEDTMASGTLLLSSREGSHPSLDYAFIEIESRDTGTVNETPPHESQHQTITPTLISDSGPKDAEIVAITGSSGYLKGRLLGTPSFLRAPDQAQMTTQEVWTVKFDGKLEDGDCGSCVFDAQTGDLYGHIISGNPDSGYAYIIPAYQIRDDLLERFGQNLQLHEPGTARHQQIYRSRGPSPVENDECQLSGSTLVSPHWTMNDFNELVSSETQDLYDSYDGSLLSSIAHFWCDTPVINAQRVQFGNFIANPSIHTADDSTSLPPTRKDANKAARSSGIPKRLKRDGYVSPSGHEEKQGPIVIQGSRPIPVEDTVSDDSSSATSPMTRRRRPPHSKVYCELCNDHTEGFRGEHELRRHIESVHSTGRKFWVCVDISPDKKFLANCASCQSGQQYRHYYDAAAHLRRSHFNKSRNKRGKVIDRNSDVSKDVPMHVLRCWMEEREEKGEEEVQQTNGFKSAIIPDDNHQDYSMQEPDEQSHTGPKSSQNSKHGRIEKYLCPYCDCNRSKPGFGFYRKHHLDRHLREPHEQTALGSFTMPDNDRHNLHIQNAFNSVPIPDDGDYQDYDMQDPGKSNATSYDATLYDGIFLGAWADELLHQSFAYH